ncbi:MAG TPA: Spy/CpxP family protein refolding chaperone [Alphaproteobacteria bacterium]
MRTSSRIAASALIFTTVVGGLAVNSPAVHGQSPPSAGPSSAAPERQRPLPGELIDARLAFLRTALKITPAQEPRWSALADVIRRHAQDRDAEIQQRRAARQNQAQTQPPTAIERLQRRQQNLARAASRLDEVVAAARPLYASFSDDQKKVADELLDRGRRHFGRGGWR